MYAIYGFCRTVDDLGDEARGNREELLNQWEGELKLCYSGTPTNPVMVALQDTIHRYDIPSEPFLKLIEANRLDQRHKRWPTYNDLLYYCDHSANPVGHLVLYVVGCRDSERQRLANYTCTALQLVNFWQDVNRDCHDLGRIYIPLEDMARFGYTEQELKAGVFSENFRRLMAFEVDRAHELFRQGLPLVDMVGGKLKLDLALFTLGGVSILNAIRAINYDVFHKRPTLSKAGKMRLLFSTWTKLRLGKKITI